jgi:hypothetical protein
MTTVTKLDRHAYRILATALIVLNGIIIRARDDAVGIVVDTF